jgi:peptidoglycan/xylan/chitin deacetylase (PgdA/CDA1 family)
MFDRELWSTTPENFEGHVRLLQRHADVIGPDDLADARRMRRGRYALITFDDGYRDNYETAFPILRSLGAPALFLVTTGFIDRPRLSWWDEIAWMVRSSRRGGIESSKWLGGAVAFDEPDRQGAIETVLDVYKSLPGERTDAYVEFLAEATGSGRCAAGEAARTWMTWDMLREMRRCGMSVGGHTVNHPIMTRLPRAGQREEIAGCARRIRAELGQPMRWLSYPRGKVGSFDADTRACMKAEGVEIGFSAYGGLNRFDGWDAHDVRRTGVEMNRSPRWLKMALTLPQIFA